nr:NADH dehydrogenase subunit 2 [Nipponacmea sp. JM-2022]
MFIFAGLVLNTASITPNLINLSILGWKSGEAAAKYFLIQAMSSATYAFGSALYWHWDSPIYIFLNMDYMLLGLIFLSISLIMKLGLFPFYAWVPGVIQGLSWFNCWLVLTWQKFFPLVLLLQASLSLQGQIVSILLPFVIVSTSVVGSVLGLAQTNLRSLIAYSSLVHGSWTLMAVSLGIQTIAGYLLVYTCTLGASVFLFSRSSARSIQSPRLFGQSSTEPTIVSVLSLAGMPPLTGFLGKWLIISQWGASNLSPFPLAMALLGSFISLNFYLSVCWGLFWAKSSEIPLWAKKSTPSLSYIVTLVLNTIPFVFGILVINL